jgi:hypothetical protein
MFHMRNHIFFSFHQWICVLFSLIIKRKVSHDIIFVPADSWHRDSTWDWNANVSSEMSKRLFILFHAQKHFQLQQEIYLLLFELIIQHKNSHLIWYFIKSLCQFFFHFFFCKYKYKIFMWNICYVKNRNHWFSFKEEISTTQKKTIEKSKITRTTYTHRLEIVSLKMSPINSVSNFPRDW